MNLKIVEDRKDKIIECHNNIYRSMKDTLSYAIEAGRLLKEQQAEIDHGNFSDWLESMPFGKSTAYNYIKVYQYHDKIPTVGNLQEAYQQIETLERQEKRSEYDKQKDRVNHYLETGEKPEGWKRGTDDKAAEVEKQGREKSQKIRAEYRQQETERQKRIEAEKIKQEARKILDEEFKSSMDFLSSMVKKHTHLNLSGYADNMSQQEMFSAIERYINSFDDISRQLEATHNLIKKLKMIANDLQIKTVGVTA